MPGTADIAGTPESTGSAPPTSGNGSSPRGRLDVVDVLRGFALMALFLVHVIESYELFWAAEKPGMITDIVFALFMGKSFSLLALCFGFSFFILMDRAARRGEDFTARFAWRLLILEGIGFLHALIYRGDIMQTLAAIGFLLLLFNRIRSNAVLLGGAAFCLIGPSLIVQLVAGALGAGWANAPAQSSVDPGMPVYLSGDLWQVLRVNLWAGQQSKYWFFLEYGRMVQILGLYLLGLVLGRTNFFGDLAKSRGWRPVALIVAELLAILLFVGREPAREAFVGLQLGVGANRAFWALINLWLDLAGTAFWALLVIALYDGPARRLVQPLAAPGRLTLTYYILQSAVFVPIFYHYGLGKYDDWDAATRLWVAMGAIAVQILVAHWWLARFQYGPIEWVWRALTYLRRDVPFRREAPARG
ncbi:hypothetical protein S2M10_32650 [Sphingomonas sp. S2M10]|uniref:DUF418 domain-containing protein n=1 Tax=Sphingomonas sp. S2M10 TaxID=2705010 RepID=UPI0014567405|nr:DUF418 domain-containing protein [Sphingomonas sp. S2M10]NLS28255.1 hypothetical protein [Sphingomonas sp. S2M10]